MQELRELFTRILSHIGIVGAEADEISKTFFNQVYAIFVEALLKEQLPEETFQARIKEYQDYIQGGKHDLVHQDVRHYMNKESGKFFAEAFLKHLKFFAYGLKDKGDISETQVKEIGELLKDYIKNKKAVGNMQEVATNTDALNSIVS